MIKVWGNREMQPLASRSVRLLAARDSAARAEALLRELIAVLDAGDFDCAAAYAEMARQALAERQPA